MNIQCLKNANNESRDVVILTVPWTDSAIPLMAPAVLKPIVEKAGMTCLAVDFNAEIFALTREHPYRDELIRFFFDEYIDANIENWLHDMLASTAQSIVSWKPRFVGLSLFSYVSQHAAKWLCYYIRKIDPNIKIIIGGPGCLNTFTGPSDYVNDLLDQNLIDYHIRGDGENSLYELLVGNVTVVGINSLEWKELSREELSKMPLPDYSSYNFELYEKKALPLVGSRGCVRQCTFCDYIANWKKFQWRTADDIFDEMQVQYQRYGIRYFKFQDSLTNGNMKEFNRLMTMMSSYNEQHPNQKFRWSGYFIFRDVTPSSEQEWAMIAASGAENLIVGIENLNEHIRYAIGKKFSNQSIDFHLAQAKKYQIQLNLLNIVGYVTETQQDIDFAKQWLRTHTEYQDILYLQWGGTLGIFPNTYLSNNMNTLGIVKINKHPQSWVNPNNGSTPALRSAWVKELNELSTELGYRVFRNIDNHFILETLINA